MTQTTILNAVSISGRGIHTNKQCEIILKPAPPNSGVTFQLAKNVMIPCSPKNVRGQQRGTNLIFGDYEIRTIEHLMSAIAGLGIHNLVVVVNAGSKQVEMPILDGCSLEWCHLLSKARIITQAEDLQPIKIETPIKIEHEGCFIEINPANTLIVKLQTDFKLFGKQTYAYEYQKTNYQKDIAPAQTFGYESELAELRKHGLALGATLENALLLGNDGPVRKLRFPEELTRHKLLDLIGDLATLGRPLYGEISAYKPSHFINIELVHKLAAKYLQN